MNATSQIAQLRALLAAENHKAVLLALPELGEGERSYVLQHLGDPEVVARRCLLAHVGAWLRQHTAWEDDWPRELLPCIPDVVLHNLACDCAERALVLQRDRGDEPVPRSWNAIETKRRWLRGEATDDELASAWAAARAAAWDAAWGAAWTAARTAARAAARAAAWAAAGAAARAAARGEERLWQIAHLADLLETYEGDL